MKKISSIELYQAKEKCLELQKSNNRLILKGNKPILLTTTLLMNDVGNKEEFDMFEMFPLTAKNSISRSYLDSLVFYLNEKYGINGIIDYQQVEDDLFKAVNQLSAHKLYSDETIRNFIQDENIQALLSLEVGRTTASDQATLAEKMSSYSFMGLTGVTIELSNRLKEASIPNHMQFGGSFSAKDFKELGYDFTDDTIAYNDFLSLGIIKCQQLPKEKVWPRTVEISVKSEEDTYTLERLGGVLIEYFNWIEQELKEKGPANAMSPMKPKTYQKN